MIMSHFNFLPDEVCIKNNKLIPKIHTIANEIPRGTGLCLDFGAGRGEKRKYIEVKGWTWIGFDLKINKNIHVVADGMHLPFSNQSFSAVCMCQVLEHISNPWLAVQEVNRVLKPGGKLFGSVSFLESFHHSYFNMSHWGITKLLKDNGFFNINIQPGVHSPTLYLHHLPGYPRAIRNAIGKSIVNLISVLYRGVYCISQAFLKEERRNHWKKRIEEIPLTFVGHILFFADKK